MNVYIITKNHALHDLILFLFGHFDDLKIDGFNPEELPYLLH